MTPKISVIIPSYNKIRFISETLDSILNQSYKNYEIIIQDGGSTDGTLGIIKKYVAKYPKKIIFESKSDGGQLNAINNGFKKATGDLVTYINADDCYFNNAFQLVIDTYLQNPNSCWFVGQGIVVNDKNIEIARLVTSYKNFIQRFNNYNLLLITNYMIQPAVFLTKKAYKRYGPFTGTKQFVTEYDLWLKIGRVQMPNLIFAKFARFRIEPTTKTKTLYKELLNEDEKIVIKYTKNRLILLLHKVNNIGRKIIGKFI